MSRSSIVMAIVLIATLGAGAARALGLFDGDEENARGGEIASGFDHHPGAPPPHWSGLRR